MCDKSIDSLDSTNINLGLFGETVSRLTFSDPKTLHERLIKNMEELGELSQIVLAMDKVSGCAYKVDVQGKENLENTKHKIMEEAVDNLLCSLSIVYHAMQKYDLREDDLNYELLRKLEKWNKVIKGNSFSEINEG